MPETTAAKAGQEQEVETWMMDVCTDLFKRWLFELSYEEKEIWLWNASVAMVKIEQRRRT